LAANAPQIKSAAAKADWQAVPTAVSHDESTGRSITLI
jgi:hypothetical protein